jgi:hypothetical protein
MDTTGTKFGKPGLLHIALSVIYIVFALVSKAWGQRANLLVVAVNSAWLLRNFLLPNSYFCAGDDCPAREYGLYIVLIGSLGMLVATLSSKR